MAYTGPPAPPPPPSMEPPPLPQPAERGSRPATVTLAAGLLLLQVVLSVIGTVISIANRDLIIDAAKEQAESQPSGGPDPETIAGIGIYVGIGFAVVGAILFVTLAMFLLRGSNAARITTWVVCGLFLCCLGFSGIGALTSTGSYPGWFVAYQFASVAISAIVYIGVIVLLLLPASNNYFKPQQQGQLY
jgi:hypothetical protein